MELKLFSIPEMLSLIYEDLDVEVIEERFVNLVAEIFSFDRVGLFFVKHKKETLQGKLCKGFDPGSISSLEIPLNNNFIFTRPLLTGFPCWSEEASPDEPLLNSLGLKNFAVIPITGKKRVACWNIKKCLSPDCPAYGKKWLRCWLLPGTKCCETSGEPSDQNTKIEKICTFCPVFKSHDPSKFEGVILVDNSISGNEINRDHILLLSIIAHAVGLAITHSKAFTNVLQESICDELTGIYNRRYFIRRLEDELDRAKKYGSQISLVLCDIDHFKKINDTYGHPTGDSVLIWISNIFKNKLRHSDVIARFGGEEFAILLLDTDKDKAFEIAEGLRATICQSIVPAAPAATISVSFGVSMFDEESQTVEILLEKADQALYRAKTEGRNRVR